MRTQGTRQACTAAAAAVTLGLALLGVAACGQETSGGSGGSTAPGGTMPTATTAPSTRSPSGSGQGPTTATASPPQLPTSLPTGSTDPQMPTDKIRPTTYPGPRGSEPHTMTHGPAPSK